VAVVFASQAAPRVPRTPRGRGARWALAAVQALLSCWLVVSAGCVGPGLEPPWSDDGKGARTSSNMSGGPTAAPVTPPNATGEFGNPTGGAAGSGAAAGSGGAASVPPTTTSPEPITGSAGAGAIEPPPPPTGAPDVPGSAGAGAAPGQPSGDGGSLVTVDFVPDCDTEAPTALASTEACRYPLPADPALDAAALQVATLDGGQPTLLSRGQSALGCLLGSDYYVDASVTPAVIVLCSQSCSALPPAAQVVAIDGCATP